MIAYERQKGEFTVTTDPARIDVDVVHDYLARQSYWAQQIPRDVVERALANSMCFGLYREDAQIGLARVITDQATFAYLCDVFVLPEFQGHGLGTWLIQCVMEHPSLQGLRRFSLRTRDAHGLYRKFGFTEQATQAETNQWMEIVDRDAYRRLAGGSMDSA